MSWQNIETAPKDGTDILLFYPTTNRKVCIGCYRVHESITNGAVVYRSEGWAVGWFGFGDQPNPTHWMPLPEPPSPRDVREEVDALTQLEKA